MLNDATAEDAWLGTSAGKSKLFIGECSLDILALKSSTVFPSVEAGVVTELPDIDFMREIADLFLRAAKLICMSADPQLHHRSSKNQCSASPR